MSELADARPRRLHAVPNPPTTKGPDMPQPDDAIVTLDGITLALARAVARQADELWLHSCHAVIDAAPANEEADAAAGITAAQVVERTMDCVRLGERLGQMVKGDAYDTSPAERNALRRTCHLVLSTPYPDPSRSAENLLVALGPAMEDEDGEDWRAVMEWTPPGQDAGA